MDGGCDKLMSYLSEFTWSIRAIVSPLIKGPLLPSAFSRSVFRCMSMAKSLPWIVSPFLSFTATFLPFHVRMWSRGLENSGIFVVTT